MLLKLEPYFGRNLLKFLYPPLGSLVLLSCRFFLNKYLFAPIGARHGLDDFRRNKANFDPFLEAAYCKSSSWTRDEISGLSKQTDLNEAEVEKWLRLRSRQNKATTLDKFCDSAWKCSYYTLECAFGFIVIWNKPWFYDIKQCWSDPENQTITDDVWWYYMLTVSYAWLLLLCLFYDVKRKDFSLMCFHHVTTITVMNFGLANNLFRMGVITMLVFNFNDIFLEGAKVARYLGYQEIALGIFGVFTLFWIINRLVLYPFWMMRSTLMDSSQAFTYGIYIYAAVTSSIFLILNIMWTYFIVRALANYLKTGEKEDPRSDNDD